MKYENAQLGTIEKKYDPCPTKVSGFSLKNGQPLNSNLSKIQRSECICVKFQQLNR